MLKMTREELFKQAQEHDLKIRKECEQLFAKVMDDGYLDEDGYPKEDALELVSKWHWSDSKGWFEFIQKMWHLSSWGWSEQDEENPWNKDEMVHRYYISTAGWSGNESIIKAMEKNDMLWSIHWYQSNRGGHYIFEVKKEEED